MEQTFQKSIFTKTDEDHIITTDDYIENASLPFDLESCFTIILGAWSWAGKSNIICQMMQAYYLHKIDAQNIYIYSPSFLSDKTF